MGVLSWRGVVATPGRAPRGAGRFVGQFTCGRFACMSAVSPPSELFLKLGLTLGLSGRKSRNPALKLWDRTCTHPGVSRFCTSEDGTLTSCLFQMLRNITLYVTKIGWRRLPLE